ncbi:MAG TPA: hypothetical protein VLC48_06550 [Gemmatimonadota bacterium]|nr:hypothetical protein [Gemmatimonadota bacterium]
MNLLHLLTEENIDLSRLARASVRGVLDDGTVSVDGGPDEKRLVCDVLEIGSQPTRFEPGDPVLIWLPQREEDRAVILGRIGRAAAPVEPEVPDEIVVEAGKKLTIRCGEGSITLREDGKVLIKGVDLVSHAKRTNRVKGGSVGIN